MFIRLIIGVKGGHSGSHMKRGITDLTKICITYLLQKYICAHITLNT
jgi:hypothetical protein